ncbi:MAG: HEAT repeat domain-containing protein [Candidatus Vogelbacteria bacterium]|nr:HEAT repeat domain-containing protein [Candidatus Vogelbacteria bacterium]
MESFKQPIKKTERERLTQFEELYKKLLANREMYRLFGGEQLSEKDIDRYVESNQELIKNLSETIEIVLRNSHSYSREVAANLIQYVPVGERDELISVGLEGDHMNSIIISAGAIDSVGYGKVRDELRHQVGNKAKELWEGNNIGRRNAIMLVRYLPPSLVVEFLEKGLGDSNLGVNLEAGGVIQYAPIEAQDGFRQKLLKVILKNLYHAMESYRNLATQMIPYAPAENRAELILRALRDGDDFVRETAARIIECIPDESEVLVSIEKALKDKDEYVRASGAARIKFSPEGDRARLVNKAIGDSKSDVVFNAARMMDFVPIEERDKIRRKLSKVVPKFIDKENSFNERLGGAMSIRYVSGGSMPKLIREAIEDEDESVRQHAALAIELVPDEEREKVIRQALKNADENVRFQAAYAILSYSGSVRENLFLKLREENNIDLKSVASTTRLYDKVKEEFFREKFEKTGSGLTLLGQVPGFDSSLREKVVARHIQELPYLNWEKAYRNLDFWKIRGFDYVPVEPIVAVKQDPSSETQNFWEEKGINVTSGGSEAPIKEGVGTFNVTAFARVLNGPTVAKWIQSFGPFQDEIIAEVDKIRKALVELGIKHGHAHLSNFVVVFQKLPDGTANISKPPRVYIIDFDAAGSSGKI